MTGSKLKLKLTHNYLHVQKSALSNNEAGMFGEVLRQEFEQFRKQEHSESSMNLRETAFAEFQQLGFPTTRMEEWKYTSLKSIQKGAFKTLQPDMEQVKALLHQSMVKSLKANRLVFINGQYYPALSELLEEDASIVLTDIKTARIQCAEVVEQHFAKYAPIHGEAMNALNTALSPDGAFIFIPKGKKPQFPIILNHITDSVLGPALAQPRNLIVVEEEATAFVIETYYSIGANPGFTNVVNEIYAGAGSEVEHYKLQHETGENYHNNFTQVFQEAKTKINQVTLTLDGKLVRNNLHFYMNGSDCNSLLYGLYLTRNEQLVDNHTRVDHASPNCFSDEKYKGILKDHSTAVFNGKIMVHKGAQKTNAYQRNQNILMSDEATVNTKPQLEIFADDVKCTHGATIGQLDEEPLFYMRSRGIPEDVARKLLLNAFAGDIAEKIKIPELVTILEDQIDATI